MLMLVWSSGASAAPDPFEPQIYAFRLPGSNGYTITVSAAAEDPSGRGYVGVTVARPGAMASYVSRGVISADSIRADFGSFGRLDLAVRRSGVIRKLKVQCSSYEESFEPGELEGRFAFRGEGGYTSVTASRVPMIPWFRVLGPCGTGSGESFGPLEPGARIKGLSFSGGRILGFQINKNRPGSKTLYKASLRERRDGIRIFREVKGVTTPGAFSFGPTLRTAKLSPPAPFAGTAVARRSDQTVSPLWTGNLTVDFPGKPDYRLAGPSIHISLEHAHFTKGGDGEAEVEF